MKDCFKLNEQFGAYNNSCVMSRTKKVLVLLYSVLVGLLLEYCTLLTEGAQRGWRSKDLGSIAETPNDIPSLHSSLPLLRRKGPMR